MINYNLLHTLTVTLAVVVMTVVGISYVPLYVTVVGFVICIINMASVYIHTSNYGFGIDPLFTLLIES